MPYRNSLEIYLVIPQSDSEEKMKTENSEEIIPEEKKKPKMKTKTIQNPLEVTTTKKGYTYKELQAALERENTMVRRFEKYSVILYLF